MNKKYTPIVKHYHYNVNTKNEIIKSDNDNKFIVRYPTVYIIIDKAKKDKFKAYVGETNNIIRRTEEHLKNESSERTDWTKLNNSKNAELIVIAHKEFNKSLTLDIENKLMQYLLSDDSINKLNNRRSNDQDLYYTSKDFQKIFINLWNKLSNDNNNLFPDIKDIRNSSIFKASPFHKLTEEQLDAKDKIISKIREKINQKHNCDNLIIIEGSAGTGKTVLLSSLFAEINELADLPESYLLVNHNEQVDVYKNIADKLEINSEMGDDIVNKPTKFLNKHPTSDNKVDIVMVDEAHLLLTQGKQAYRGKNQLKDIISRSKIVVAVIDPKQVLTSEEYIESNQYEKLISNAKDNNNLVELKQQNRIQANINTIGWIDNLIDNGEIKDIPYDDKYEIKIFNNPSSLYRKIKSHNNQDENILRGLSRLVATFDWDYKNKSPENSDYWRVNIGNDFSLPWNLQLPINKNYKNLPWAEQPQTIDEVGSTYTIQGFDLNYCGLIIGPSVKFRNGKIVYDPNESHNKNAKKNRTLSSGKKVDISEKLLNNELNVLIKRGVHGLYIYAVDRQLREELIKKSNNSVL